MHNSLLGNLMYCHFWLTNNIVQKNNGLKLWAFDHLQIPTCDVQESRVESVGPLSWELSGLGIMPGKMASENIF